MKNNVKKLYQKLFESETEEGIKYLLEVETITDKDIAIAFKTTQKKIREIRKSLDSKD